MSKKPLSRLNINVEAIKKLNAAGWFNSENSIDSNSGYKRGCLKKVLILIFVVYSGIFNAQDILDCSEIL
jgi:hypothetical protein